MLIHKNFLFCVGSCIPKYIYISHRCGGIHPCGKTLFTITVYLWFHSTVSWGVAACLSNITGLTLIDRRPHSHLQAAHTWLAPKWQVRHLIPPDICETLIPFDSYCSLIDFLSSGMCCRSGATTRLSRSWCLISGARGARRAAARWWSSWRGWPGYRRSWSWRRVRKR